MKRIYLSCFFMLVIVSCSNNKNSNTPTDQHSKPFRISKQIVSNEKKEELDGKVILEQDSGAINIHLFDTILFLRQMGDGNILHLYNTKSLNPLGVIGRKGEGPNDFISPRLLDQFYYNNDELHAIVFEARKSELRTVNIPNSLNQIDSDIETIKKLHPSHHLTQFLLLGSDSSFIGNQGFDAFYRKKLIKLNKDGSLVKTVPLYPEVLNLNTINSFKQYQLYFDYIRKNPSVDKYVSALSRFDQIDIFSPNIDTIISIKGPQAEITYDLKKLTEGQLSHFYYKDVRVDDEYIYALYHNQLMEDYLEKNHKCEIRVFTWQGKLVKSFIVDYLVAFAVDPVNKTFYGLDMYNERILSYSYTL